MSFVGDLEHLPIVDVIQLLHATRKSGTLCLKSSKGESQLVFNDGCIVSANHANNSVRIGQILVQMGKITREDLDITLTEQQKAGTGRVPLIASLIESGRLKKEDAFKGLETLIEMTIVEVLTWTEGTFELDVDTSVISDEYRYIPEKLKLDLNLNTQNVLMDALRIYDEKKRDGTLTEDSFAIEPAAVTGMNAPPAAVADHIISIDDLGLDVLDDLEKVIPGFFTPVKVHDPTIIHREKAGTSLGDIPQDQQERLFAYLSETAGNNSDKRTENTAHATHALILFSSSEFIRHTITTVCKNEGFFTFATDDKENLEPIIGQSLSKELQPVILLDQSGLPTGIDTPALTAQILENHPEIPVFHLTHPTEFKSTLDIMNSGARAVIPRPASNSSSFVEETIIFLETIKKCLKVPIHRGVSAKLPDVFRECMNTITTKRELTEITTLLDRYISLIMGRSVTFVHRRNELVCESISRSGTTQPLAVNIPVDGDSPLHQVMSNGDVFLDDVTHPLLDAQIYRVTGRPAASRILVAPFKCLGRVLAVTYGDFGTSNPSTVDLDMLSILFRHAGIVYENALYRKKFEKMLHSQH